MYIYIYMERERERSIHLSLSLSLSLSIYIYTYTHTFRYQADLSGGTEDACRHAVSCFAPAGLQNIDSGGSVQRELARSQTTRPTTNLV